LKRKHRIGIASITIALITTFALSLFIFGSKGINILTSIEETRYIYLSSKRESIVYNLYKNVNSFQIDIETLSNIKKYENRAKTAKNYNYQSKELSVKLSKLLNDYDLKLLNYNVNNELSKLAIDYYKTDALLLDQQSSITEYLEVEYQLNNYLFAKSEIIFCYTNINTDVDKNSNIEISNKFKKCNDRLKLISLPSVIILTESIEYEKLLSKYLNRNIELYKILNSNDVSKAKELQNEITSLYKQIQSQNIIANNEIISILTKAYLNIGGIK